MYSQKGNIAFLGTVGTAAILSAIAVGALGLTNVSLAILILLTFGSVLVGKWLENTIAAKEESDFNSRLDESDL